MSEITRNPLCWPDNIARTPPHLRQRARFDEWTLSSASNLVLSEINRLNGHWATHNNENVIVSSNLKLKIDGTPYSGQSEPADTGVAVYFQLEFRRGSKTVERPIVMTCDKWTRTAWNLYAIGKDIEAQRGRTRWGCTNFEQAFRGYLAIPANCSGVSWWELLGIPSTANQQQINVSFRELAKTKHPDRGGTTHEWNKLQEAHEQALAAVNGVQ